MGHQKGFHILGCIMNSILKYIPDIRAKGSPSVNSLGNPDYFYNTIASAGFSDISIKKYLSLSSRYFWRILVRLSIIYSKCNSSTVESKWSEKRMLFKKHYGITNPLIKDIVNDLHTHSIWRPVNLTTCCVKNDDSD